MSDSISRMTVNVGTTTLSDIAKTFEGDTNKLYAKRTDEGIVLYSKPGSSIWDKIALTRGPDGTIMSKANAKKMLAQRTVANAIDRTVGERIHKLGEGPSKLKNEALGTLIGFQSNIQKNSLVGSGFEVTGTSASGLASAMDQLLGRLESIKNQKAARTTMPELSFESTTKQGEGPSKTLMIKEGKVLLDAPPLMIGGERYEADRVLAEASNIVVLYKKVGEGDQPTVVVKLPDPAKDNGAQTFNAAVKELVNNKTMAEGKTNVSGFTDGVKLEDGRFALIGKVLPNGDFDKLARALDQMTLPRDHEGEVPKGKITAEERDLIVLTALKDGLTALSSIHEGRTGGVHRDVKPQNFMIDENGMGQLVDFGESVSGDVFKPEIHGFSENASYLSPEANLTQMTNKALRNEFIKEEKTALNNAFDEVSKKMFGENTIDERTRNKLRGDLDIDITRAVKLRVEDASVGTSMDVWGMGLTLFELSTGKSTGDLLGLDFMRNWNVEQKIALLPKTHDKAVTEGGEEKGPRTLAQGSGNPAIDKLINQLLTFDPAKRPSAKDLLNAEGSPLKGDLVGSESVRQLMIAVASGNADTIDLARGNMPELQRVQPNPKPRIEEKPEPKTEAKTETQVRQEPEIPDTSIEETFDTEDLPELSQEVLNKLGLGKDNAPFVSKAPSDDN